MLPVRGDDDPRPRTPRGPDLGYAVVLPLFAFLVALPDSVFTSTLHVAVGAVLVWLSAACGSSPGRSVTPGP
ncbi:hypothetical protein RKD19_000353 [Streptomyces canus]